MVYDSDHAATHDLVSDSQGRTFGTRGPARSAIEPHSDPHRLLKAQFARRLAQVLTECLERKDFDRLVIAAPPVMLGELRQQVSDKVRGTIIAEFALDLTKIATFQLAEHLTPLRTV